MIIEQERIDMSTVALALSGRLDTASAPMLEMKIKQWDDTITKIILDFSDVDYISSMGLRVLLQNMKTMKEKSRQLVIKNISGSVREVFEMTGFLNLMVQEEKFVVIRRDEPTCTIFSLNGEMKADDISVLSKELYELKEKKSHRQITKDIVMSKEFGEFLAQGAQTSESEVILDLQQLSGISSGALKRLNQIIDDTAWEGRKLFVRNASEEVQRAFKAEGLSALLEE